MPHPPAIAPLAFLPCAIAPAGEGIGRHGGNRGVIRTPRAHGQAPRWQRGQPRSHLGPPQQVVCRRGACPRSDEGHRPCRAPEIGRQPQHLPPGHHRQRRQRGEGGLAPWRAGEHEGLGSGGVEGVEHIISINALTPAPGRRHHGHPGPFQQSRIARGRVLHHQLPGIRVRHRRRPGDTRGPTRSRCTGLRPMPPRAFDAAGKRGCRPCGCDPSTCSPRHRAAAPAC